MATGSKLWANEVTLYQTDAFGGVDGDVGDSETTLGDVNLETSGYYGVQLRIKVNSSGTTNDFDVFLYASLDGTNFDTVPITSARLTATGGGDIVATFLVRDLAHFRIRGKSTGVTDTFDVEVKYQAWRHQST